MCHTMLCAMLLCLSNGKVCEATEPSQTLTRCLLETCNGALVQSSICNKAPRFSGSQGSQGSQFGAFSSGPQPHVLSYGMPRPLRCGETSLRPRGSFGSVHMGHLPRTHS